MTEADHKPTAQLPPKSPEWMRAAVGKPFEELPEGLQRWIEDNEADVHFRFAQDVKHCEADLVQLAGQRGRLSFKEFEAARSFLEKRIDAAKSQQKRLVDAEPADRLLVLAWIIEGRKSTGAGDQAAGENARPAWPPVEAPGEPVKKRAFDFEEAKSLLAGKKVGGGWRIAPSEKESTAFLSQIFETVTVHQHRAIRKQLWPHIPRGRKKSPK